MQVRYHVPDVRRSYWEGIPIVLAGLCLLGAVEIGHLPSWTALPGGLLCTAAGTAMLFWPGDGRLPQFGALGAVLGALAAPVLALAGEESRALLVLILAAVAFASAGWQSLRTYPLVDLAPEPERTTLNASKVALDEALLGLFVALGKPPRGEDVGRILDEVSAWDDWLERHAAGQDFQSLYPQPPDLLKIESRTRKWLGQEYRHATFSSGYEPAADMPGADRWQTYGANRSAHAWLLEHSGPARPWLLTIHGYRMGEPWQDLSLFDPRMLHRRFGLNVASVVLPLHGARRRMRLSGGGYLEGELLDFVHAELQAMWDIRRLMSWLRLVRHAPDIGVYGVSLGGYNTALLAGVDDSLACAVAGVPVVSMASTLWRHFPPHERQMLADHGLDEQRIENVFAAASPLSFAPKLEPARLGIYAGAADRLVWPDHPLQLQAHWRNCELGWYQGSHLSFIGEPVVEQVLENTLTAAGLLSRELGAAQQTG